MNRWSLLTVIFAIILSTSLANAAIGISACGVKLATSGAYVVTANLTNPSNATPCITVNTEYVNIDLNGFTLTGRGADFGIRLNAAYLTVSNGQLTKFGYAVDGPLKGVTLDKVLIVGSSFTGAILGDDARVINSQFIGNLNDGLDVGANAVISGSVFEKNTLFGFKTFSPGVSITNSTAANNSSHGFATDGGATLIGNTANGNGADGFVDTGSGTTYQNNSAKNNNGNGFGVGQATLIGNTASNNQGNGFNAAGFSTFQNNSADSNSVDAFHSGEGDSTFTNNTATNSVTGFGFNLACPSNLIGNTAQQNFSGSFNVLSGSGCNLSNNLF
jgi:hypothetical protein